MKHSIPFIAFALTVSTMPQHSFAVAAKATGSKAVKLEGMNYKDARRIIMGYGWKSYSNVEDCSANNKKDSCEATPEIMWCKFALTCQLSFHKQDQCLYVNVKGGPRWNSYIVKNLEFARGEKCPAID